MEEGELVIKSGDIRTMKKDIVRLEKKGEQMPSAAPVFIKSEKKLFQFKQKEQKEKAGRAELLYVGTPPAAPLAKPVEPVRPPTPPTPPTFQPPPTSPISPISPTPPTPPTSPTKAAPPPDLPIADEELLKDRREEEKLERIKRIEKEKREEKREVPVKSKESLLRERAGLEKEKNEIGERLEDITKEKRPFNIKKEALLKELEEVQKEFSPINKKEKKIEKEIAKIEKKEAVSRTVGAKRRIEQRRWKIEEKRREIEKERWPWDEKLKRINDQLENVGLEYSGIIAKEKALKDREDEILEEQKRNRLKSEKISLEENIDALAKEKYSLGAEKSKFNGELKKFDEKLASILLKEEEIEENKRAFEEQERAAENFEKRRELERQRWEIEEKRRKIESERWEIEGEKGKIEVQEKRIDSKIKDFLEKETNLKTRIDEINQVLASQKEGAEKRPAFPEAIITVARPEIPAEEIRPPAPEMPEIKPEIKPESEVEEKNSRIEEAKRRIEVLKKKRELSETAPESTTAPYRTEPSREELLIRPGELEKEIKKPFPPAVLPAQARAKKVFPGPETLPKKPSLREKFWVRILIFSLVLALLVVTATFWYWYLVIRKQAPAPEGAGEKTEESQKSGEAAKESAQISAFPESFLVDDKTILEISDLQEVKGLFVQAVGEQQDIGKFKQIVIKNTQENKNLNLKEILGALDVELPEEFYQKTGDNFTLFVYSQLNGKRIGFIAEVKDKAGLINLLLSQEPAMKNNFNPLLNLMEETGPALVPYFREASQVRGYVGPNFRYQTLSKEDLGLCYLVSDNYFIFTASWKSMTSVADKVITD